MWYHKFMNYKAVISDIDGTLISIKRDAYPSNLVKKTVKKLCDKGYHFCLASGRPFHLVKHLADYLKLSSPCIVDNGAVIIDSKNGSVLWEANLANDEANEILSLTNKFNLVRTSCDTEVLENPKKIPILFKVRKISIHDISPKKADKIIDKVSSKFKDVACVKATSYKGKHLTDVYFSNINATKQHAVLKLAEIIGISYKEIVGVGDGYNDFPLLMACGLKVAMGNAVNELKEIADHIAPTVEKDGLANAINKYFIFK